MRLPVAVPTVLSALLLALTAAASAPAAAQRDRVPPATPAGAPVRCIPVSLIRESQVRSDRVIDFVMRDRKVYRNTLPSSCPGLGFERRFGYTLSTSQLCSVDIVTVLLSTPLQRGASCGLGEFQPVKLDRQRGR